jgi:hypothetical protein
MTKKLAVPMLVLGLALYGGCGSSSSSNTGGSGGSTGGAGGSTGGSGGSTGGSGGSTGGSGGSTGGSGGATGGAGGSTGGSGGATGGAGGATDGGATDGSAGDATAGDGGPTADFCAGYVAGSGMLAGKMASDFCLEYATVCTFGGDMRYMNMGDCVTKYSAAAAAVQTCRAGHLCNAKTGDKTVHCPHATGLGLPACM